MKRSLLVLTSSAALAACASNGSKATGSSGGSGPPTDGPLAAGTIVDAGLYTLTVLGQAMGGNCDPHAEQPSTFVDATEDWGLAGVAMDNVDTVDLDHDGYPDLIVFSGNADQREVIPSFWDGGFHNLRDGGFLWDVGVLMNRPKADGGRMFVDETAQSGLFQTRDSSTTEYRMAQLAAVADVNNDGNPDILSGVARDASNKDTTASFVKDTNEVMLNDGRGHFSFATASDPGANTESTLNQVIFTDIDNDGKVDLFFTYWYANPADNSRAVGNQPQLYKGNGDGTFSTITLPAGLGLADSGSLSTVLKGTNARPAFGAMACDLNGDGFPELLVSAYGGESNMLYVNDGTGGFQRFIQDGGFDGDTDTDYRDNQYYLCYCTVHRSSSYCAGAASPEVGCPTPADSDWSPGFSDAPALANGNNFSAACRDMNGDGRIDVFQGTIRHWWAGQSTDPSTLLINRSAANGGIELDRIPGTADGVVYPHIDPQGWNEGIQQTALVDMNNDGLPDILNGGSDYSYQYGHLFIQQSDGTYQDLAQQWGLNFPCMDGLAVADFDRDGDLDVIGRGSLFRNCAQSGGGWPGLPAGCSGASCTIDPGFAGYTVPEVHIFTNNAGQHSHWLEIRLRGNGITTNTMGIGARVTVTANGTTQMQELQEGHGIGSEMDDPTTLFFGLGACAGVDSVSVTWPNQARTVDTWANVPADDYLELRQADPNVYGVNL